MYKSRLLPDRLLQQATTALRQNDISAFTVLGNRLLVRSRSGSQNASDAAFSKLAVAELFRASGNNRLANDIVQEIAGNPPMGVREVLSAAERLAVSLLLDGGQFESARLLAAGIDGLVIENAEAGANVSLSSRSESDISIETHIIEGEANLFAGALENALNLFEIAINKIAAEESALNRRRVSAFEVKKYHARFSDLRFQLQFWGAVVKIIGGDKTAYETLDDILQKLQRDEHADQRLSSRIRAVLGQFDVDNGKPPVGIGLPEAARLWKLVSEPFIANSENFSAHQELSLNGTSVSKSQTIAPVGAFAGNMTPFTGNTSVLPENRITEKFEMFLDKFGTVLDKLSNQNTAPAKDSRRPFAFGGGFKFVDLVTWLGEAENAKLTGFILVQWDPDLIETSVLAGNISQLARKGEGFIFMRDGVITDACIGSYDPETEFAAGTEGAEADAKNNLKILIQIGMEKKLDNSVEGFGEAYSSMAVKSRPVRYEYEPSMLMMLITEIDNELFEN